MYVVELKGYLYGVVSGRYGSGFWDNDRVPQDYDLTKLGKNIPSKTEEILKDLRLNRGGIYWLLRKKRCLGYEPEFK